MGDALTDGPPQLQHLRMPYPWGIEPLRYDARRTSGGEAMTLFWTPESAYLRTDYANEADLETAILLVAPQLFGPDRAYLDVKKKIGRHGGQRNIPDGYLIDLSGSRPRLYVVENELAAHDPLRHIAVQILQFSLSFEDERRTVRRIVFDAIGESEKAQALCARYLAGRREFRNLDHLVDALVLDSPFTALVIIDAVPDNLEKVLGDRFNFGVEVIELARFETKSGERAYQFQPFLADLATPEAGADAPDPSLFDTVVVPARDEGFEETFIGQDCWFAVRIHGAMRPQIKYVAAYRVAPLSAITHIAPVQSIEPIGEEGKWILHFSAPAIEIGPIALAQEGRVKAPQNIRYTTRERLEGAATLDELW